MEESVKIEDAEALDLGTTYCRCCLSVNEEGSMDNMFELLFESKNQEIMFHEVINILTPLTILPDDGLSQVICEVCRTSAIDAYLFRQTCITSNERVLSLKQELEGEVFELEDGKEHKHFIVVDTNIEEGEEAQENSLEHEADDESNEQINCQFCDGSFSFYQDLVAHIEDSHQEIFDAEEDGTRRLLSDGEYKSQVELDVNSESHSGEQDSLGNAVQASSLIPSSPKLFRSLTLSGDKECAICGKRFETPSKLKRHLYVHRDVIDASEIPPKAPAPKKYQCKFCSKRVETPSKLKRHMNVHMKDQNLFTGVNQHRPIPCSDCNLRFWDKTKLERHKLIHSEAFVSSKLHLPDDHLFTCVVCLQKIPDYDDCLKHMRDHRKEIGDNTSVSCKLCPKVYPKLVNLIRHSRIHPENATHQCVYCDKLMGMGEDFIEHMLRHKGFKPYVCEIESCGKSFEKGHKLRQHMESHGGKEEKMFCCDICDKSFSNIEYLKRHLLRHSGIKNHICQICSARFTFMTGLNSHMSTHSDEKPFQCDVCTSSFSKLSSLRTHQRAHAGDKRFGCEICKVQFITSSHLRRHMLTHSGIKPFQCSYCEKAYAQSNDLKKHLRVHLGPNVFQCDINDCTEAFPKFVQLKNHKLLHYSNESEMFTEESYGGDIETMVVVE